MEDRIKALEDELENLKRRMVGFEVTEHKSQALLERNQDQGVASLHIVASDGRRLGEYEEKEETPLSVRPHPSRRSSSVRSRPRTVTPPPSDLTYAPQERERSELPEVWHESPPRPPTPTSLGPPSEPLQPSVDQPDQVSPHSVRTASLRAAYQHAQDILATVNAERQEFAREREAINQERDRLLAEVSADHARREEDGAVRIKVLEGELEAVRSELENEKQQRTTMEAEARERESQALLERDEAIRNQLGDITNLVQDQREAGERWKELMDARWEEKQSHRQEKDDRWRDLQDIVRKIQDDVEGVKNQAEEARIERETKPGIETVIEELQRQNAEQRELLNALSESWRADCTRQHQETIESVRSTAQEQVPFNLQGYLDEFSKALASEVRVLLGEVGTLREERRALQHELGFLLCTKSKYDPGGDYDPDWKPPPDALDGSMPPEPFKSPKPPLPTDLPPKTNPVWRAISSRIHKKKEAAPPSQSAAPPVQDPRQQPQWWANWQTNFELTVGKLREERRALQYEIGNLLSMRAKFSAGGEFDSEWKPLDAPNSSLAPSETPGQLPPELPPGVVFDWGKIRPRAARHTKEAAPLRNPPPEPPPEPPLPPDLPQAKPAWRTVHPRIRKKKRGAAPPPQQAAPRAPDPRHQIQSWATWQPDPQFAPSPQSIEKNLAVPEQSSPGLFGPRTPLGSMYEGR